ncbi:MAG: tail fiber protein [Verrucomicrobiota bacterium JB023]|nr:tail fiber protein [Verrucomicrobiota bacterium JB023]
MSEPFLGEIRLVGFNFAPRGWALCDGQILPISQYSALFSLLGTMYGGDGRTSFALPDLRGRFPRHPGNGPGLDSVAIGQRSGSVEHTLTEQNLPPHTHEVNSSVTDSIGTKTSPVDSIPATANDGESNFAPQDDANQVNNTASTESVGGGASINHLPPYLGVNHCIALTGLYPSRS